MKKKSYSVCSNQFSGSVSGAQLASNNLREEEAISDPSSFRFPNLSNLHIKLKNVNSAKFVA